MTATASVVKNAASRICKLFDNEEQVREATGGGGKLSGTYASDDGSMVYTFSGKKVTAEAFGQKGEATYELKDGNFIMTRPDGKTESYPYKLEGNKFSFNWFGTEVVLTKK